MKSNFWASVIAITEAALITFIIWLFAGKPMEFTQGEDLACALAYNALYLAEKNDLLRKED